MEKISKTIRYNKLFNLYGKLLSSTQQEILESYFCFDLSISEIALERDISRAAVEDALSKGSKKLEEYESLLHLLENNEEILKNCVNLKKNLSNPKDLELIEDIERRLK